MHAAELAMPIRSARFFAQIDGASRESIAALLQSVELDCLTVDYVEGLDEPGYVRLQAKWRLIDSRPARSLWRRAAGPDERPDFGDAASSAEMMAGHFVD